MLIKRRRPWELRESEVTAYPLYRNRRQIMTSMGAAAGAAIVLGACDADGGDARAADESLSAKRNARYSTDEDKTDYKAVTSYNNFYEFGTDKADPKENAHRMEVDPWSVAVEGHVAKSGSYAFEDLIDMEKRASFNHVRQGGPVWNALVLPIAWVNEFHALMDEEVEPSKRQRISDLLSCGRTHDCAWAAGPDEVPGSLPLGNCPR